MHKDIIIDTQEIKEHVSVIGRVLSFMTNMIIGTDDNKDHYLQSNLIKDVLFNDICKTLERETPKGKKDIQELSPNELCVNLCSSDSDEDDSCYVNDNREKASPDKSELPSSSPLLASIEFCDNASAPNADSESSCAVVDIEILEENNNHSNNNLDSVQSFQEQANLISVPPYDVHKMESTERLSSPTPGCSKNFDNANNISVREFTKRLSSPKPGCSKDFDDANNIHNREMIECTSNPTPGCSKECDRTDDVHQGESAECLIRPTQNCSRDSNDIESDILDKKIHEEAIKICSLLPKFTYQQVYAALCQNGYAENRIELCLWDLLPWKRPMAQFPTKRKFVDDSSVRECKKMSPKLSIDEQKDTGKPTSKQAETQINLCDEDIIIVNNDNLPNYSLNGQDALNIDESKNKKTTLHENYENNKLEYHSGKDNKVPQSIQNGILKPAKLVIKRSPPSFVHVTSSNHSILSPSKLTYVTAPYKNQTSRKTSTCDRKCKDKKFISNSSAPIGRNVFRSNSTNLSINNSNNSKDDVLHKYMKYLQFMQDTKSQHLFGNFKDCNIEVRNATRQLFLWPQSTNSNINTSQFVNKNKVSETVNPANINCDNNVPNNLTDEKICSAKSVDSSCQDVSSSNEATINLQMPLVNVSTSTKSGSSNFIFPDIVTVDLTTAVDSENLSQIAPTNTGLKSSNNILSCTASTETAMIADGSSTPVCQLVTNSETLHPIVSSTQTPSNSIVTNSNIVVSQAVSTGVATSVNKPINTPLRPESIYFTNSNDSTAKFSNEPSTSTVTRKELGAVKRKVINQKKNVAQYPQLHQLHKELISTFPNTGKIRVGRLHLKDSEETSVTSTKLLQELREFMFEHEKICPVKNDIKQGQSDGTDEQYAYLSGIFPDADTTYLRKIVARMNGKHDAIIDFIQSQWDHPTYPTKEEKLRRIRITEQQKQYISNFDVKQFFEIFPDPFKYFENPHRQCKFSSDAFKFLRLHFKDYMHQTLKNAYKSCNYHLTFTAMLVESMQPDRVPARVTYLWEKCLSEDIPLLQECAFIMHKAQIRKYFDKLKKEEDKEFQKLKENNELLECQCCYDNECMPSKCSTCNDGHIFCNSCVVRGTESKLALGETRIPCFVTCDGEFSLPTLQKVLSPTQFNILIGKRQEEEVMAARVEGLVSCPFCHFASIPPPEDKIFKCLNPECMKESCRLCKELNHVPLKCYEKETDKARLLLEEKMTEALVRKCYKCGRPYFKEDGCNKITCSCGALMCYICDKPVTGYGHFNDNPSQFSNLCPLMSNNDLINTATVQAVADKTIEYIQQKDPNIKLHRPNVLPQRYSRNSALLGRVSKIAKFDT